MYYGDLRSSKYASDRKNISSSLLSLRTGLAAVPEKRADSLLLATWNIRELGGSKYGPRTDEALYCIAETISRFDLVAIQEVRADLKAMQRILRLLGKDWDYIYTDVSYAKGGNGERLAFVWDRSKVNFTGLAGELVLPPSDSVDVAQIARTPFVCGFQAGWAKFNLCTVHIYYGEGVAEDPRRVEEIKLLASLLSKKAKDYIRLGEEGVESSPENLVMLGDFNIFKKTDATFKALSDNGFVLPAELMKDKLEGSNVAKDKFYDQIAFFKEVKDIENTSAGIFDFYEHVFTLGESDRFAASGKIPATTNFKEWRTYQMSDHLVMWSQFKVDKSDTYLKQLRDM